MSYSLYLYRKGLKDKNHKEFYDYEENITYNVNEMLEEAFGKNHFKKWADKPASEWVADFAKGVSLMTRYPEHFREFNSPNGWGTYEDTLSKMGGFLLAVERFSHFDGLENVYLMVH